MQTPKIPSMGNNGMLVALILSCVFIYMSEFQMGNNKIYKKGFFQLKLRMIIN